MKEKVENRVIEGVPIEITRKQCKRLTIKVRMRDASVVMSVPRKVPDSEIDRFVRMKREWILGNIDKAKRNLDQYPEPETKAQKEALRWALKKRIEKRLPVIEALTDLHCSGWTVRDMHTRWGSCNTMTKHINLSLMLAQRSDDELDYVILHELVHTKIGNHGPEFYACMDELMPEWRRIRKGLKG